MSKAFIRFAGLGGFRSAAHDDLGLNAAELVAELDDGPAISDILQTLTQEDVLKTDVTLDVLSQFQAATSEALTVLNKRFQALSTDKYKVKPVVGSYIPIRNADGKITGHVVVATILDYESSKPHLTDTGDDKLGKLTSHVTIIIGL